MSDYDSALLLVNSVTGETLIIPDSSLIIHDIVFDASTQTVYTLGFEQIGSNLFTVIKKRTGDNFSKETILFQKQGDSVHASLAFDEHTHRLFFTLGDNIIYFHTGSAIAQLEKSSQPVRKIIFHGDKIFSLNSDSSITVWSTVSGKTILDFFLFEDAGWILLTRDGKYHSQGGGENHLNVFEGSNIFDRSGDRRQIEDKYRLNFKSK
ncbi:MAG: hypothetical protein EHM28_10840 [Spirochaetaceae bacterium]|nr:MAG: hypothetical protein EHM28_10840 [Spirochaetaceae bacterium]